MLVYTCNACYIYRYIDKQYDTYFSKAIYKKNI